MSLKGLKCVIIVLFLFNHVYTTPMQPDRLTCESILNPLGIAEQKPRLTWTFKSSVRDQQQSAFQIIVSENPLMIQQGKGNVW